MNLASLDLNLLVALDALLLEAGVGRAAMRVGLSQPAMSHALQRLRANIMKSMGLTQEQLNAMSPDQQKAVEQKIEQLVQQELQKNAGKTGQLVDMSA